MTAESVEQHRWALPPRDGYTVDDLLTLPDLPPHTELIDGSLILVSPQRYFHFAAIDLLVAGLRRTAPPELGVVREMTVVLDKRNGPEPDVSVIRASAKTGRMQTHFQGPDVVLAIEVVSPESESRDRTTKFQKYASAGIRHYWLVEAAGPDDYPVIQVYELGQASGTYALTGIHHDHLKLSVPFDIDIDLTAIDEL
ncbi:Uma2 family endonuclease [Streptomyces sp. Je 1-332]|uniref:Uma2 family endonuclease n=1 Tax=unclassified Streptomyces TaxID=2593676 RepID=UPI00345AA6CD